MCGDNPPTASASYAKLKNEALAIQAQYQGTCGVPTPGVTTELSSGATNQLHDGMTERPAHTQDVGV